MNAFYYAIPVLALLGIGCASAPTPAPSTATPWPDSVAKECPRRKIPLECFRRSSVDDAMKSLIDRINACYRPDAKPILVKMHIETRAGTPTCVEQTPRNDEQATCIAKVVARHLLIPNSAKDEECQFTYPIRFE